MVEMLIPISRPDALAASSRIIIQSLTYSALAFHILDWLLGLSFEVQNIWKKRQSSVVKWQYLWSRYIGIAAQIGNTVATRYIHTLSELVPRRFCDYWQLGQMLASQMLLLSLEISLINRLHALSYSNRILNLRTALYALVTVENVIVLACGITNFGRIEINGGCLIIKAPIQIAITACAVGVTHGILWGLTIHNSWRKKAPITSLVMRDGSWVFGVLSLVLVGCIANVFAPRRQTVFSPFSAFVAVTVASNCRIIINMEKMTQREPSSVIELTSHIETTGNTQTNATSVTEPTSTISTTAEVDPRPE